ncbi:MAG: ATP-binding protein, partial [Candidatus Dormibacteraceae bacterium]
NLIFNAVDAMPEGGTLSLRTLGIGDPPTHVAIDVIDTGIGMDEATRRRCFEPFYTTKGERGSGLGMAMVYGAIKRHSAEIAIDSAPNVGTSVRLIFLAHTAMPVPEKAATVLPSRGLRILVVDDNPSVLESLSVNLELDGHQVVTAKGGELALETLRATQMDGRAFEVVITDFGMPRIDGGQVARTVKELSPKTFTILLSGWGRRMLEQGEVPKYVDHILAKPPELDELRAALAQCC